jgi:hypothetical protein
MNSKDLIRVKPPLGLRHLRRSKAPHHALQK